MGGVTRLTVALAVIMIEISDDVHMLLPILLALMLAKWIADAVTHSLYHGLLEARAASCFLHGCHLYAYGGCQQLVLSTLQLQPVAAWLRPGCGPAAA